MLNGEKLPRKLTEGATVSSRTEKQQGYELYRQLAESSADYIYVIDRDFRVKYVNLSGATALRMSPEDVTGKCLDELFPAETAESMMDSLSRVFESGKPYSRETTHHFLQGDVHTHVSLNPIFDDDGKVGSVMGVSRDISDLNRAERALRESEEKYRGLVDEMGDWICDVDENFRCTYSSPRVKDILGYRVEEVIGRSAFDFMPSGEAERVMALAPRDFVLGDTYDLLEIRLLRKDGRSIWIEASGKPILDAEGRFKCNRATIRDITRRKLAEEALRSSEEKFRALFDNAGTAIVIVDFETGVVLDCNSYAEKLLGRSHDEITSMMVTQLHPPEGADAHGRAIVRQAMGGSIVNCETEALHKDGRRIPVIINITPIAINGKKVVLGFFLDISERKRAEEILCTTLRRFYMILSNMHGAILLVTEEGRVEYANEMFCKYFFLNERPSDLLGLTATEIIRKIREAYRDPDLAAARIEEIVERWEPVVGEEVPMGDGRTCLRDFIPLSIDGKRYGRLWHHIDITERKREEDVLKRSQFILARSQEAARLGSWAWNVLTDELSGSAENWRILGFAVGEIRPTMQLLLQLAHPDDRETVTEAVRSVLKGRTAGGIDYRVVRRDGSIVYVNTVVDKIVRDREGNIKWVYGINQDISERKKIEEKLAKAKADAELYVDLMGHDINNLNQAGIGFLEMAQEVIWRKGKIEKEDNYLIERPLSILWNSSDLIKSVRMLQQISAGEFSYNVIDLSKVMTDILKEYEYTPERDVTFIVSCDDNVDAHYYISANELVKDIFYNLINNSIKHSDPGKPLVIRLGLKTMEKGGRRHHRVCIEDNGPGISDAMKKKLFSRLQRGDTRASGRGLGLFIVRSLVEKYGGSVWAGDRVPGDHTQGARFVVLLPAVDP